MNDMPAMTSAYWQGSFRIVLVLTIPVLIYSKSIGMLLHFAPPAFPGSRYLPFAFSAIIFFYGGWFFIQGAVDEFRNRLPGMMTLVALAITVAFLFSVAVTFGYPGEDFYWELCTLIAVMLLGHWLEMRAIGSAKGALHELAKLLPDTAERIQSDGTVRVPISDLREGDLVLVRPGSKVPADGVVEEGESEVDESMITGESRPVHKASGSEVIAGTINGDGSLRVRVMKVGDETVLAGITRLVSQAQASKSRAQDLADRAAYWLTITAVAAGAVTFLTWILVHQAVQFAVGRSVTVLVIARPHALGLAIPLVVAISTTLAARNGLLVRDRMALENARSIDLVVFDKTGTLTRGQPGVVGIYTTGDMDEDQALETAASVERDSEHSLARAIVSSAVERGLSVPRAVEFEALPGLGARAKVDGRPVQIGGPKLLESLGLEVPEDLANQMEDARSAGHTIVYLIVEGRVMAALALADVLRPESREAIAELKTMGISTAMLTGDGADVAEWVAKELGIEEYYSNVLPQEKAQKVREIRESGRRVAMVGDGVNDAPALASADVGIAIGAGTDVAVEAGGIILVRNDPRDVARVIRLSRASYRKMLENLVWATGYNAIAIPLAAGVLAGYHIILPPAIGALLMSVSTVVVALNAQLLRRLDLQTARAK